MKNQFKKSLSLIMAVLMLLSCWVWVAPTEAEAADVTTQYYVIFKMNVTDTGNENSSSLTINWKYSNGKGSASSTTKSFGQQGWSGNDVVIYEGYINGFPTSVSFTFDIDSTRSERHENYQLLVGKDKASCTKNVIPVDNYTYEGKATYTKSVNADDYPVLTEGGGTLSPESLTLGKVGTSTNATSKLTLSGFKDQYGVAWGDLSYTYGLNAGDGVTLGSHASISTSSNTATITVKPSFQTLFPGKSSAKLYIPWTASTKSGTATIDVSFPTYTITFDANGGKIGASDADGKDKVEVTSNKMNIGSLIGKSPAYRAKDGFDFDGFYSTQNPDATGLKANFSGTKFVDNESTVPSQGDITYYAAWVAKTVTATFITADNQLIGEVEGRYNNYLTASNMYNGDAGLNAAVKASHTSGKVQFNGNNEPIYKDGSTNYTFAGWKIIEAYDEALVDGTEDTVLKGDVTFQAVYTKADAATYTVTFEDGAGNIASSKSGYKYRDAVTGVPSSATKAQDDRYSYEFIGWAKKLEGVKFFAVDQYDCDKDGVKLVYTSKDAASFVVKGDATYVPVFRMTDREYKVTYSYKVDGAENKSTEIGGYLWEATPIMPEIKDNYTAGGYRYYIIGWKVGTDETTKQLDEIQVKGDTILTAVYGNREAAKYTINFYGKDEDGVTDVLLEDVSGIYEHNSTVTAPTVAQTIDTADALYTFAGWSPAVNTTASGDADYYATYTKKDYADLYFYNYDGTLIYSLDGKENTLFVGETIPVYSNIDEETNENVLPSKAEDVVGTYNFTGWKDGNGNDVVPGTSKFDGDTFLYAQFETVYKDYTVKFLNDDGSVVKEKTYHYGTEIEIPENPTKAADETYTYDFRAWSPEVSEVCYGDATYTATYRRTYKYYKVTWYKDNKNNAPAMTVLSESNYIHNAKIQQGVMNSPETYPPAATGKTWALKHWVQCNANGQPIDADGNVVAEENANIFKRGDRMGTEHLYFYPVFEEVDNILTVKFYKEDGTTLIGEYKAPYNTPLADFSDAFKADVLKAPTETHHYAIEKWVNVNGGADVTNVTADVSVKPFYKETAHTKDKDEILVAPTCTETGLKNVSCSAEECDKIWTNVIIDMVPDEGKPIGQIYVGTDLWKSTATVDYTDVKYVGPATNVIVNAQDTGSVSEPWNAEGKLYRGVGKIEYYISQEAIDDFSTITEGWTTIYDFNAVAEEVKATVLESKGMTLVDYAGLSSNPTEANKAKKAAIDSEINAILASYKANATGVLSNLGLLNGEKYIINIKVTDREISAAGNVCYFSSGMLHYGTAAPEIAVTGNGFGTKFCAEATVTVTDDTDGVKVYLDNEEVTLTDGKFICSTKGVHTVTAIDKNGNKTTKTFEIKGGHTYRNYTIGATCENAGSKYDLCVVCGEKANEAVIPALGHSYTVNYTEKEPTCVVDGSRTYVCDNNCGTKLTLNPTDAADVLATAKKWVEGENGAEGSWVALAADDLKHLKATGTHTYAKVKDEAGNDTAEDAWVIDKVPTCTVEGSKHKDCIKCGLAEARVTEVIPVDTVNGHKFYREKVTSEPLCQEIGKKTKTCRYCGYEETTEYIPALGHVAGEYVTLVAPTCTEKGSEMLTCSVCGCYIGEGEYDPMKEPVAKEIPALGHAWKLDGEIWQATEENADAEAGIEEGKWYQNYVCGNDAAHKKTEEVEGYQPPVAATVTFDFNGGYYEIPAIGNENELGYVPPMLKGTQTVSAFVGEFIAADEVETAFKLDNATKTYAFSHWADADGKEVKFPVEVKGDATYYAVYTEKYINYTITYYTETVNTEGGVEYNEYKKTGYLHNGEEVTLAAGPSKAGNWQYTYKFAGWKVKGGEAVYTDKVTIDGANINLVATYTEITNKYAVTYAYSSSNIIHTYTVVAGSEAPDVALDFDIENKAYDTKYHYDFKAWNKANQLANVQSNIYTTPDYESVEHVFTETIKTEADCTANKVITKTCACGYSYDKEVANSALGHIWGDPVYNAETGKNVQTCQREGCGVSQEDTRTFTVKFYINADDERPIKTVGELAWGKVIDSTRLPVNPTKDTTATTEYTFKHWAVKGTTDAVDLAALEIKQDYEFVAVFTETTRKYNVIFRYDGGEVIKAFEDVLAGSDVVTDFKNVPTKTYDDKAHYVFRGWKGYDAGLNITVEDIQAETHVIAAFDKIEHTYNYDDYELIEATTCGVKPGYKYTCTGCDYSFTIEKGDALDHTWEEINRVEPSDGIDGYVESKCSVCGEEKKDVLAWVSNTIILEVKVLCNGEAQSNVLVKFVEKSASGNEILATTGKDGIARFQTEASDNGYDCYVSIDGEMVLVTDFAENANGNYSGTYSYTVADVDCSCACHRDNLWGAIFRFFHKIIKFFTGEFKCCGNPDPMYG